MAAPESRCGLEVQQTSVQKQTHLFCPFSFQFSLETIHCFCLSQNHYSAYSTWTPLDEREKNFLISLLHRHLTSFNECPRVLPAVSIWNISVNGITEKPWAILKTSIKSARFRCSSKVHSRSFCNLFSYCNDLILIIIRVKMKLYKERCSIYARHQIFSNRIVDIMERSTCSSRPLPQCGCF